MANVQFQFNLLPKTSKEEIKEIKKRDESITYGFFLIFFGIFLFLILNIVQIGFIKPQLKKLNSDIKKLEATEATFSGLIVTNGELVKKSQLLEQPLKLDIKINDFLDLSDSIFNSFGKVISYDRDPNTGNFLITITLDNIDNIVDLLNNLSNNEQILNPKITSLSYSILDNNFSAILQFSINNIVQQTNINGEGS
jgi:hypothetical protein